MRISDWSSDVCSSDLLASGDRGIAQLLRPCQPVVGHAILLPFAEAYSVVAEQLARARPGDVVDEQALLDAALVEGRQDRKRVVWGKGVSVRVDLGGRRILKKKKKTNNSLNKIN